MGRKFSEEEISRIFEQAAKEQEQGEDHSGLTLSELQSIGAASGLSPSAIERAAKKIKLVLRLDPRKRKFKSDIGVGGTAELPGKITTSDWEELLPEIRNEFNAPGNAISDGYRKEWSNGNLKVLIENGRNQDRLRLSSTNARKIAQLRLAMTMGVLGVFFVIMGAAESEEVFVIATMTLMAAFATYWLTRRSLKKWANKREAQMAAITEKAGELAFKREDSVASKIDVDESVAGFVNGEIISDSLRDRS